ncbi:hypothetical protein HDE_01724 [Halotydeus destructor]|nr:hypothetical protein HDE_04006 [Halotydeus destructor]KAI1304983.1 hypothetical protein HDE_01724 [Halotydeus destructor]
MAQLANIKKLLRLLTVEPFLFFIFFSFIVKQATYTQFYQDKVCLVTLGLSNDKCSFVSSTKDIDYKDIKAAILTEANDLNSYQAFIQFLPTVIFTIMLAPWADKVKGARRKLMIWAAFGQIADNIIGIVLIIYEETLPPWTSLAIGVPSSLAGGGMSISIATLGYAAMTTPADQMPLRFIIMDIVGKAVRPLTTFLSGQLVGTPSWIPNKVRNFTAIYILALVAALLALMWVLIFVDESDFKKDVGDKTPDTNYKFFNKENAFRLKETLLRTRDNLGHIQVWVLVIINGLTVFVLVGPGAVRLSYVQTVYGWNIEQLNNWSSLLTLSTLVGYAVGSPVLTNKFKLSPPALGIFGLVGTFFYILFLGSIMDPAGFFIATIVGTYGSVNGAAVKTLLSRLVEKNEKSSAFAVISVSSSFFSLIAKFVYPWIFKRTINTMPGLGFQLSSVGLLVAIILWIWIDFHTIKTLPKPEVDRKIPEVIVMQTRF